MDDDEVFFSPPSFAKAASAASYDLRDADGSSEGSLSSTLQPGCWPTPADASPCMMQLGCDGVFALASGVFQEWGALLASSANRPGLVTALTVTPEDPTGVRLWPWEAMVGINAQIDAKVERMLHASTSGPQIDFNSDEFTLMLYDILGKGERRCGWRRRPEVALREVVNGGGARCGGGEVLGRGAWIWGSLASRLGRTWVAGDGGQRFGRQRGDCGGGRGRQRDREELGAVLELVLKIVKFWSFP
ncbi:uncharacterized protein A4U43_C07F220 [Asparagus officinalis]|uniref:Uncharacterized protein n=1 Tax=Asparagus officinalis TaxID=4686 RepID=A0A5P1E820_ASPOF|nr:uncharacterized protein A4U43_C07F220 [Asparagus officinalis]